MNEYDSAKMADVLARRADGYEPTADVEEADLILFNTCSVREKAQEKVFSDLGRVKHLKARGALIGVGGCVASQEGAAIVERAPYVDLVFGPQTLHRLPELLARRRARSRPQVDIRFPEIEKFDHLPPARVDGADRVRLDHGRLLEVLQLLRRALHARRRSLAAARRRARRSRRPRRPGRPRGHAARPERQRLPRRDGRTAAKSPTSRLLLEYVAEIPGIERHPLHDQPPERIHAAPDRRLRTGAKLVDHLHLPVQHGSDRILRR